MKYGLMSYDYTTNLGNEIQSIAARQFLPKVDYFIEHEKLNLFRSPEKVKMIMNAWYLDCLKSWPPSDSIDPLLISMHFTTSFNDTRKVISSKESRDFFSRYGPVGCRDYVTLNMLEEFDIDAYYSGCLTLTLNGANKKDDYKYIVVNCLNSKEVIEFLKTKTDLPIYDIYQETLHTLERKYLDEMPTSYTLTSFYDHNEKFFIAENILKLYENAHCVITDRVHCAFPCLAFKTPVLFFNSAVFAPERFKGIGELVLQSTLEEYIEDYDIFDVENPPENSNKYLKIRKDLIQKTKKFTGHMSDSYEIYTDDDKIRYDQTYLLMNTSRDAVDYMLGVIKMSKRYEAEISKQKKIIEEQEKIIKEMKNSNSWKFTKPLRNFTKGVKK